jgi:hypothetical protein
VVERKSDYAPAHLLCDGQHARFVPEPPAHDGLVQWTKVEYRGYPLAGQMGKERFPHLPGLNQDKEPMVICLAVGRYRLNLYQPALGQRGERLRIEFV